MEIKLVLNDLREMLQTERNTQLNAINATLMLTINATLICNDFHKRLLQPFVFHVGKQTKETRYIKSMNKSNVVAQKH